MSGTVVYSPSGSQLAQGDVDALYDQVQRMADELSAVDLFLARLDVLHVQEDTRATAVDGLEVATGERLVLDRVARLERALERSGKPPEELVEELQAINRGLRRLLYLCQDHLGKLPGYQRDEGPGFVDLRVPPQWFKRASQLACEVPR